MTVMTVYDHLDRGKKCHARLGRKRKDRTWLGRFADRKVATEAVGEACAKEASG
jgi:hypothetical protein